MNTTVIQNLDKQGVYLIKNTSNDKVYVGSTTMSFNKRFLHHINRLRNNKHKNQHLQHAWNKYGENSFEFIILEVCEKSECLIQEQIYIDKYNNNSYNINLIASGTPNMSKEVIMKRAATMKKKYDSGEIVSNFKKGHTPWNKGKSGEYSTESLKVPKTITDKVINANKKRSKEFRISAPNIDVFTICGKHLGTWRSSVDLQEQSFNNNFILIPFINSRFKTEIRGTKPYHFLSSKDINRCAKNQINSYKNLVFKYNTAPS